MQGEVRWWRVIAGAVLITVISLVWAFWLNAQRMRDFDGSLLSTCAGLLDGDLLASCVHARLASHLADSHWGSRLFLYYVLSALVLGGLWLWRSSRPLLEAVLVGGGAGFLLVMAFDPPWLLALGASSGVFLAGLLLSRRRSD